MAQQRKQSRQRPAREMPLTPRRSLGTFTSDKPDGHEEEPNPLEGIEFTLDGVTFACKGELDLLDKSELMLLAMSSQDTRSPQGIAMIAQFLQLAFGPVEYMRFKMHVREHRTPEDTQLAILSDIGAEIGIGVERETGRPTGRRSPSSPGRAETDERVSRVISLGQGDVTIVDPDAAAAQTG